MLSAAVAGSSSDSTVINYVLPVLCFVYFSRWRHRERSLPTLTASCCCFVQLRHVTTYHVTSMITPAVSRQNKQTRCLASCVSAAVWPTRRWRRDWSAITVLAWASPTVLTIHEVSYTSAIDRQVQIGIRIFTPPIPPPPGQQYPRTTARPGNILCALKSMESSNNRLTRSINSIDFKVHYTLIKADMWHGGHSESKNKTCK